MANPRTESPYSAAVDANQVPTNTFTSGTVGTSDTTGTAEVIRGGANPATGAQYVEILGIGGGTIWSGTLPVVEQDAPTAEDNTNGVIAGIMKPVLSSSYSPLISANFGANLGSSVKGTSGNVYSVHFVNLSGSTVFLQFHNVGSANPIGSIPVYSYPVPGGSTTLMLDNTHFSPSHWFSTGISVGIGTALGTLGTTGLTASNFIWHIHYV